MRLEVGMHIGRAAPAPSLHEQARERASSWACCLSLEFGASDGLIYKMPGYKLRVRRGQIDRIPR